DDDTTAYDTPEKPGPTTSRMAASDALSNTTPYSNVITACALGMNTTTSTPANNVAMRTACRNRARKTSGLPGHAVINTVVNGMANALTANPSKSENLYPTAYLPTASNVSIHC